MVTASLGVIGLHLFKQEVIALQVVPVVAEQPFLVLLQINNLTGPWEKSINAQIKINVFLIMEDLTLLLTPIDHDQWPGVNSDLQRVNPEIIDLYLVNLQIIDLHLANSEIIDLQLATVIQINR